MVHDLAFVRVAASRRRFLLSWRLGALYLLIAAGVQVTVGPTPVGALGVFVYAAAIGAWWFNRAKAVWVERDENGITIRTRRWAKYEDLAKGRLRSDGTITHEFSSDESISYDPDPISWWRADRTLTIGSHRFAVHPEARKLAERLADSRHWVTAEAQAPKT